MKDTEKETFANFLAQHFPQATGGDAKLIWGKLKGYDLAVACEAVEHHRVERGVDVFRPDSTNLARIAAGLSAAFAGTGGAVRVNGVTADDLQRQRQQAIQMQSLHDRARSIVAGLDADDRERLRQQAVDAMPVDLRKFYSRRDPVKCPPVAMVIASIVTGDRSFVA